MVVPEVARVGRVVVAVRHHDDGYASPLRQRLAERLVRAVVLRRVVHAAAHGPVRVLAVPDGEQVECGRVTGERRVDARDRQLEREPARAAGQGLRDVHGVPGDERHRELHRGRAARPDVREVAVDLDRRAGRGRREGHLGVTGLDRTHRRRGKAAAGLDRAGSRVAGWVGRAQLLRGGERLAGAERRRQAGEQRSAPAPVGPHGGRAAHERHPRAVGDVRDAQLLAARVDRVEAGRRQWRRSGHDGVLDGRRPRDRTQLGVRADLLPERVGRVDVDALLWRGAPVDPADLRAVGRDPHVRTTEQVADPGACAAGQGRGGVDLGAGRPGRVVLEHVADLDLG